MTLISPNIRLQVVQRAGNRCEYCHLSQESQVATLPVDHLTPVTLEGETELENLGLACPRCNSRKWTRVQATDPSTGSQVPLFNPRTQVWGDHFRWSETMPEIMEPLTSTGRATVALLELNSQQHQTIRRLLMAIGIHPPS